MRIHPEGKNFLVFAGLAAVTLIVIFYVLLVFWLFAVLSVGALLLFLFFLQFFRHPYRLTPAGENIIVSPADGKVVVKEQVNEPEYLKEERTQISIFMAPFDVHVNRVPVSGVLEYYRYHPGKYLAAYNPKSSELNEMNSIGIANKKLGKFFFRQIAGVVARRICFYPKEGDYLKKGYEMGFIKFGSRMDLFVPLDYKINVEIGDQVYGGETVIAKPQVRYQGDK